MKRHEFLEWGTLIGVVFLFWAVAWVLAYGLVFHDHILDILRMIACLAVSLLGLYVLVAGAWIIRGPYLDPSDEYPDEKPPTIN